MAEPSDSRWRRRAIGAMAMAVAFGPALVLASCSSSGSEASDAVRPEPGTPATIEGSVSPADRLCAAVGGANGVVAQAGLDETSGVVASRTYPDVLWAHDDSGGDAEIFAIGLDGSDLGRVGLAGLEPVDWEDIALLPGTGGGPDQLLVADVGDNLGVARGGSPVLLHRFDEPVGPGPGGSATTAEVTTVRLVYPDGPRDAEAVLADPSTGDVVVVSKQWDGAEAGVYRVPAGIVSSSASTSSPGSTSSSATVTMERVGSVAGTLASLVTGGDISADGQVVVLRTYADVRIWAREPGTTIADAFSVSPRCTLEVDEPQGEAVAVLSDGSGFVTVSEGESPDVMLFRAP